MSDLERLHGMGMPGNHLDSMQKALGLSARHDWMRDPVAPTDFGISDAATRTHLTDAILRDPFLPQKHRDPEAFYYLEWPLDRPVKTGEYTCDLYRHQESEELFEVEVVFPKDGDVKGAVSCRVQAENLTKPVEFHIPVSRLIENFELTELAKKLVAEV